MDSLENIPQFFMKKFNDTFGKLNYKILSFEQRDFKGFTKYRIFYESGDGILGIFECTKFKKVDLIDYKDNYMTLGEMKKLFKLSGV